MSEWFEAEQDLRHIKIEDLRRVIEALAKANGLTLFIRSEPFCNDDYEYRHIEKTGE